MGGGAQEFTVCVASATETTAIAEAIAEERTRLARRIPGHDRGKWPARDRLLCALAWDQPTDAEAAVRDMVAQRYDFAFAGSENPETLRIWAETESTQPVLARWRESADGDEPITALALAAEGHSVFELNGEKLIIAFNCAFADTAPTP